VTIMPKDVQLATRIRGERPWLDILRNRATGHNPCWIIS
jgi:hypothetical protein